jgi:hypothetical protein
VGLLVFFLNLMEMCLKFDYYNCYSFFSTLRNFSSIPHIWLFGDNYLAFISLLSMLFGAFILTLFLNILLILIVE